MENQQQLRWHGFTSTVNLLKATFSLSLGVGAILWTIMTWALDSRYAPIEVTKEITKNGEMAAVVNSKLNVLSDVVIGEAVFAKRLQYCNSTDMELRQQLDRQLAQLIRQYKALTGSEPYIPSC